MSATYIPFDQLPNYLDPRLREVALCAALQGFPQYQQELELASQSIQRWASQAQELMPYLEYHGLSGLFYSLHKQCQFDLPESLLLPMKGATVKHLQRWQAISTVLDLLDDILAQQAHPFMLMKGVALAGDIYTNVTHRPMSDIDILADEVGINEVYRLCRQNGFLPLYEYQQDQGEHHLPPLVIQQGQHRVFLELHRRALSNDLGVPMNLADSYDQAREIKVNNKLFKTFSHYDMLKQLCYHTFSRDQVIKLLSVVDVFRYAIQYQSEIEWERLKVNNFHAYNALCCSRMLLSLRAEVFTELDFGYAKISGLGLGMLPLREYRNANLSVWQRCQEILFPSRWWQHVFYQVPPQQSLFLARYVRHPLRVFNWLLKRIFKLTDKI